MMCHRLRREPIPEYHDAITRAPDASTSPDNQSLIRPKQRGCLRRQSHRRSTSLREICGCDAIYVHRGTFLHT